MARQNILILGGARSGKSTFAQRLAKSLGRNVLFVATAQALDREMAVRINAHRKARPASWRTIEAPSGLALKIESNFNDDDVIVVDCITLLVSNILTATQQARAGERKALKEIEELLISLRRVNASFVIVSNEVGLGLVPDNTLGRLYRDVLGKANQALARQVDEVYLMVAGIPLQMKG